MMNVPENTPTIDTEPSVEETLTAEPEPSVEKTLTAEPEPSVEETLTAEPEPAAVEETLPEETLTEETLTVEPEPAAAEMPLPVKHISTEPPQIIEYKINIFTTSTRCELPNYISELERRLNELHIKHEIAIVRQETRDAAYADGRQKGGDGGGELTFPYNMFNVFAEKIKTVGRKPADEADKKAREETYVKLFERGDSIPESEPPSQPTALVNTNEKVASPIASAIHYCDTKKTGVVEVRVLMDDNTRSSRKLLLGEKDLELYLEEVRNAEL